MTFPETDLAALDAAEEIDIETRATDGTVHRTIVWVMVRDGVVYVRSYLGAKGRWYREALADSLVALHVGGRRLEAQVIPAPDAASVQACNDALRAKYPPSGSVDGMLVDDVLPTTLRVVPA